MLVSIEKNLAFLAMTKAASTSIHQALEPHCDIVFTHNSRIKHMSARKFRRFMRPYFSSLGYDTIETCCLLRDPIDWLFSWYKYRSRPEVSDSPNSTANQTFQEFCLRYIELPERAKGIGRPLNFMTERSGAVIVDHVFRYDALPVFIAFLEDRFQTRLDIPHLNASPSADFNLHPEAIAKLTDYFAPEYEIYAAARH